MVGLLIAAAILSGCSGGGGGGIAPATAAPAVATGASAANAFGDAQPGAELSGLASAPEPASAATSVTTPTGSLTGGAAAPAEDLVTCPAAASSEAGKPVTVSCSAPSAAASVSITWTLVAGPAGFTLPPATGLTLTFTPPSSGEYRLLASAVSGGKTDRKTVVVTAVPAPNGAPEAACTSVGGARAGQPVSVTCTARDDGQPAGSALTYSWSMTAAPASAALSGQATNQVSFTPAVPGAYDLRLTVSDGALQTQVGVRVDVAAPTLRKILPLGDSITNGFGGQQSYRYALWRKLIDVGAQFDYVGTLRDNDFSNPAWPAYQGQTFDRDHEGHSGWRADEIGNALTGWIRSYGAPDIVLIHLGTNDLLQDPTAIDSTLVDLRGVIERLRVENASVRVYVARIIPVDPAHAGFPLGSGYTGIGSTVTAFNARLPGWASGVTTVSSPVVIVDQYAGFDPAVDTFDGIHPVASGEEKLAQRWFDAIRGALLN